MKYARYAIYAFVLIFITTGCVRNVHQIPLEDATQQQTQQQTQQATTKSRTLYDTTKAEGRHALKAEPFSLKSNKKDPELLGAQRTSGGSEDITKHKRIKHASMSKSQCISLIGQTKFDIYTKRFGGEAGAIRRCIILKRLRG